MKSWFWVVAFLARLSGLALGADVKSDGDKGRELSLKYCTTCHIWPSPDLLDRRTWREGAEPLMRKVLGISQLDPAKPSENLVLTEWNLIWNYYAAQAPVKLSETTRRRPIEYSLTNFTALILPYGGSNKLISMVQVDPMRRQIQVGNADTRSLDLLDPAGELLSRLSLESPMVQLLERPSGWMAPLIWSLSPHDERRGRVIRLNRDGNTFSQVTSLAAELPRPVHMAVADLNGDGLEDWVVCGYGHTAGELTWFENTRTNGYLPHILLNQPGAIRCAVHDMNGDSRPDIVVLTAQGREQLLLFTQVARGQFEMSVLRDFPPTWGSSFFSLVDFDRDGSMDILMTNGDSGEYRSCLKPYHGVRLFRNAGGGKFTEKWFLPTHGAYKAIAADFDQDGDLDVAVISFFPDYAGSPQESFVMWENTGNESWIPRSIDEALSGRWLVMDAGDIDGDGDIDIVLGAANHVPFTTPPVLRARWATDGATILLLRNETARFQKPRP